MGETKKMKHEEIEAAAIALGIVILIAGAKHAVASLLEQWRALVFLLLNLVVLNILFTSINSSKELLPVNTESETITDNNDMNEKKKKKKKKKESKTMAKTKKKKTMMSETNRSSWSSEPVDHVVLQSEESMASSDHENDDNCEARLLSKEELNAKAEAFILMFRQQLALDAQRRRSSSKPSFSANSPPSSQLPTFYAQKEIPISS